MQETNCLGGSCLSMLEHHCVTKVAITPDITSTLRMSYLPKTSVLGCGSVMEPIQWTIIGLELGKSDTGDKYYCFESAILDLNIFFKF